MIISHSVTLSRLQHPSNKYHVFLVRFSVNEKFLFSFLIEFCNNHYAVKWSEEDYVLHQSFKSPARLEILHSKPWLLPGYVNWVLPQSLTPLGNIWLI